MVGVNSSKLFEQTPASKNQGKSVMNMSILSSKPPLLDQIKNNFEKILGLGSALIPNSKNREENYNSNSGSPYFYDKIGEPQSSEIRLGEESSSLLNKPPMHPKFASTLKKGLLKPPQMMGVNPSGSKHQSGKHTLPWGTFLSSIAFLIHYDVHNEQGVRKPLWAFVIWWYRYCR